MFSIFRKSKQEIKLPCVDIHSHLLPGIDDGVNTIEESLDIIRQFSSLGYLKLITTPHIMGDFYTNTSDTIMRKLDEVKKSVQKAQIPIEIEAAAEYYFDEYFIDLVTRRDKLLTFGDRYILFELGFVHEPLNLKEIIFELVTQGYKPVLAHPERYGFYYNKIDKLQDLVSRGVYLQLNINSITGYYSKEAKHMAEKLIDADMVRFAGSDCHNQKHFNQLCLALNQKTSRKLFSLEMLNDTL